MSNTACLKHLKELTELRPNYADIWNNFGIALLQTGVLDGALLAFDRALEINPQFVEVIISRCFLLGKLGKEDEGFRNFRHLHVRSPGHFNTVLALGIFCMRHGWKDTGLSQLICAEKMRPRSPFVLAHTAAAFLENGNAAASDERVQKANEILNDLPTSDLNSEGSLSLLNMQYFQNWENPNAVRWHTLQADFYSSAGDVDKAEEELRLANTKYAGNASLMVEMGRIMLATEKLEEALKWISGAIMVDAECHQPSGLL